MGTHPIFESDFDCLTDRIMDFINKKAVPDVELSEEDLDALGSLSKTNVKGMQFNPYTKIDPKYMDLNNAIESDDDDEWFYATDEQKPRNRSEKLFLMVGSKFYSQDMSRKKVNLMRQFPEFPAGKPAFYELNNRIEYWTLSRCITKDTCPRYLNMLTGTGRLATLGAAAFSMTAGLDWMNTTKIGWIRDLKRWKW